MDADLERTLRGLQEAADFAKGYRFELTDEYLALIARVEAMPRNRSGANKSGRWLGSRSHAGALAARATLVPRKP
jgi:hypothetical protein